MSRCLLFGAKRANGFKWESVRPVVIIIGVMMRNMSGDALEHKAPEEDHTKNEWITRGSSTARTCTGRTRCGQRDACVLIWFWNTIYSGDKPTELLWWWWRWQGMWPIMINVPGEWQASSREHMNVHSQVAWMWLVGCALCYYAARRKIWYIPQMELITDSFLWSAH